MSENDDSATATVAAEKCCASCGTAAIDDIKLKPCPKCDRVEYCSDECQQEHLKEHENACKERAAELYDELLFKQPDSSHLGDCPICFLPMPIDVNKSRVKNCCGQMICRGCIHANNVARRFKRNRCPFCRHLTPETEKECEELAIERANALGVLGSKCKNRGNYESAFDYWSRAAALGDVDSIFNLSTMYRDGEGVEEDRVKERALLEKAAIAGHPYARYNLGIVEVENGNIDRAVKHWIIAASLGEEISVKTLRNRYKAGHVRKDDFAAALRAYQAAVDAMKSPQREATEKFYKISE